MLCRRCDALSDRQQKPRLTEPRLKLGTRASSARRTESTDGQCSACGAPLETDPLTERVLEMRSQLARFGLADREEPLLKAPDPKE